MCQSPCSAVWERGYRDAFSEVGRLRIFANSSWGPKRGPTKGGLGTAPHPTMRAGRRPDRHIYSVFYVHGAPWIRRTCSWGCGTCSQGIWRSPHPGGRAMTAQPQRRRPVPPASACSCGRSPFSRALPCSGDTVRHASRRCRPRRRHRTSRLGRAHSGRLRGGVINGLFSKTVPGPGWLSVP